MNKINTTIITLTIIISIPGMSMGQEVGGSLTAKNVRVEERRVSLSCPYNTIGNYEEIQQRYISKEKNMFGQVVENPSDWFAVEIINQCSPYLIGIQKESQHLACKVPSTGEIVYERTFEAWSDGKKSNVGPWVLVSHTCQ